MNPRRPKRVASKNIIRDDSLWGIATSSKEMNVPSQN